MYMSAAEEPVTHLPGHSIHKGVAFLYQRETRENIAVIVIPYSYTLYCHSSDPISPTTFFR